MLNVLACDLLIRSFRLKYVLQYVLFNQIHDLLKIRQLVQKYVLQSYYLYFCFGFYAASNMFSVISRRFLSKLPESLVHLSWKQLVSRNANPNSKEGTNDYHF